MFISCAGVKLIVVEEAGIYFLLVVSMQRDLLTERSFAYQVANYEIINNNKANQNQMNDINEHTDLCHHQWYSFSIGKQKKTKVTIKFDHFFFFFLSWI